MSLIDENYEYLAALVLQAARGIRRQYPIVALDDLIQVGWEWCLKHPERLGGYLEDEDEEKSARLIAGALRNVCKQYAREEKAALIGYAPADEAFYSLGILAGDQQQNTGGLLHFIYDDEAWLAPPQREVARNPGDPAEGMTWQAMLSDVSRAVAMLDDDARALIEARFRDLRLLEDIGAEYGRSKATISGRLKSRIRRVQTHLGGFKPHDDPPEDGWENGYVGTRRVISNGVARAITDMEAGFEQVSPTTSRRIS